MPAYSDLLVGYAESSEERNITLMRYAGRCISCGRRVHVVPSAFDILQRDDCDAKLICMECDRKHPGAWERELGDGG
jgi:hypothetical protein